MLKIEGSVLFVINGRHLLPTYRLPTRRIVTCLFEDLRPQDEILSHFLNAQTPTPCIGARSHDDQTCPSLILLSFYAPFYTIPDTHILITILTGSLFLYYTFTGAGLLKMSQSPLGTHAHPHLPIDEEHEACFAVRPGQMCGLSGDVRTAEQPGLTALHTVFFRQVCTFIAISLITLFFHLFTLAHNYFVQVFHLSVCGLIIIMVIVGTNVKCTGGLYRFRKPLWSFTF